MLHGNKNEDFYEQRSLGKADFNRVKLPPSDASLDLVATRVEQSLQCFPNVFDHRPFFLMGHSSLLIVHRMHIRKCCPLSHYR